MANKVVLAALQHVWATLEPTHCPRALIGGLSLSFWKHVRSTQDVDLLIDPAPFGIEPILDLLKQAGVQTKRQPPVVDLGSVRVVQLLYEPKDAFMDVQIDLLLAESAFHREALARRVPVRLNDVEFELFTLSCEDLLILKMSAGRIIDRAGLCHDFAVQNVTAKLKTKSPCKLPTEEAPNGGKSESPRSVVQYPSVTGRQQ